MMSDDDLSKSDIEAIERKKTEINEIDLAFFRSSAVEASKASIEYAKLVIQNLCFINSAALIGVPSLSSFVLSSDVKGWDRVVAVTPSVFCFALGIVFGLLSGYFCYLNFMGISHSWNSTATGLRSLMLAQITKSQQDYQNFLATELNRNYHVRLTFWAATICGLISMALLLVGSANYIRLSIYGLK